ncbi:MAG TPA: hypothetical protein DD706_22530 [Nitrospiraceae bacterium]|nr:hypothetical protein [Nitrospiraceae bacterium]
MTKKGIKVLKRTGAEIRSIYRFMKRAETGSGSCGLVVTVRFLGKASLDTRPKIAWPIRGIVWEIWEIND